MGGLLACSSRKFLTVGAHLYLGISGGIPNGLADSAGSYVCQCCSRVGSKVRVSGSAEC